MALTKATRHKAQDRILGREGCSSDSEIPFTWLLDDVSGQDSGDYGLRVSGTGEVSAMPGTTECGPKLSRVALSNQ